jgi:hypothetical protein
MRISVTRWSIQYNEELLKQNLLLSDCQWVSYWWCNSVQKLKCNILTGKVEAEVWNNPSTTLPKHFSGNHQSSFETKGSLSYKKVGHIIITSLLEFLYNFI